MKAKFFTLTFLLLFLLAACTPAATPTAAPTVAPTEEPTAVPAEPVTLNVFAAASLTEAFTEMGKQFEAQNEGVTVVFNFAGSSQLAQQISEGAPVDVFASANQSQMDVAVESTRITADTAQKFVTNRLVVVFPVDNAAGLTTLQDLGKPGLRVVLAAEDVPVGGYSLEFLDKAAQDAAFSTTFKDEVLANVASYEENVKAVLSKVVLDEADAGIVYTSDISGENASKVGQIEIPDALNVIAKYPIAPLADSTNPDVAAAFIAFVLSPEGQQILANYGFIPVIEIK